MWMSDEKYTYIQDCKEKKSVAASARRQRSHCGKGGSVKLPSDFKTRKELKAMNGECKTYRMNEPMTWDEFKSLPDDLKVTYIKNLRERFNVPDRYIGEMMGVHKATFVNWMKCLGLNKGKDHSQSRTWDRGKWFAWVQGDEDNTAENAPVEPLEDVGDDVVDIPEQQDEVVEEAPEACEESCGAPSPIEFADNSIRVIPKSGTMTFEGNNADDILQTVKAMLGYVRVNMTISWEVV